MATTFKYKDVWEMIRKHGETICPGYELTKQNEKQLYAMALYFCSNKEFENLKSGYSLNKGLLLMGPVGTGKTISMRLFQKFSITYDYGYRIVTTRHVTREFSQDKHRCIDRYGRLSFEDQNESKRPLIICFDDLGLEEITTKHYGNETSVIGEILLDRYEGFVAHGMKTHLTTNLDPDGIQEAYGIRIRDRLKEMVNTITFTGKSLRK